jgi:hypothetical protein
LFLEFELSGELSGVFAVTIDDAGAFRDRIETERRGGLGTLEQATIDIGEDLPYQGASIWTYLIMGSSQCPRVNWEDGLEDLLEVLSTDIQVLNENDIMAFHIDASAILTLIPNADNTASLFVLVRDMKIVHTTSIADMDYGVSKIAKNIASPNVLYLIKNDTRWEDEGSEGGVYRSQDYGGNWKLLDFGEGFRMTVRDIALSLGGGKRLAVVGRQGEGGFYRVMISDDEGENWRLPDAGLMNNTVGQISLVGIGADDSVYIMLPGGRMARWGEVSFMERFMGVDKVKP